MFTILQTSVDSLGLLIYNSVYMQEKMMIMDLPASSDK